MNLKDIIFPFFLINLAYSYFDLQMDRFEILEQDKSIFDWSTVKVRKVGKNRYLVGDIKFLITLDNDVTIQMKAFKKQGGEYRLMPYKIPPTPFCDFVKSDGL